VHSRRSQSSSTFASPLFGSNASAWDAAANRAMKVATGDMPTGVLVVGPKIWLSQIVTSRPERCHGNGAPSRLLPGLLQPLTRKVFRPSNHPLLTKPAPRQDGAEGNGRALDRRFCLLISRQRVSLQEQLMEIVKREGIAAAPAIGRRSMTGLHRGWAALMARIERRRNALAKCAHAQHSWSTGNTSHFVDGDPSRHARAAFTLRQRRIARYLHTSPQRG
jgi:hypothetical protein